MHTKFLLPLLTVICSLLAASPALSNDELNDGPYLIYQDKTVIEKNISSQGVTEASYQGPLIIPFEFQPAQSDEYSNVKKLAAISDIHGQVEIFKALLINNKIIDEKLNWRFGEGHLVITGDIFDRGDTVTEALWLVYRLEQQAAKAGGKVHYLLGNHEYMVLRDDQRYLHPKYINSLNYFNHDLRVMFSNNTVLGRWLRAKSTIIKINDMVFLHGGIHTDYVDLALSLKQANNHFRETIGLGKKALNDNAVWRTLHGKTGPIWYRGYFREPVIKDKNLEQVLTYLGASYLVVGHTSMPELETRFNNRVIAIDSSIKLGKTGELLLWQNNQFTRGTINGKQTPLW